jgi:hypothetical protein
MSLISFEHEVFLSDPNPSKKQVQVILFEAGLQYFLIWYPQLPGKNKHLME